jgi:DNA-binding transcriptional LysR family regulator
MRERGDSMVIKQLIYVAALGREQHFGRAAKSCHVSQPSLSSAIRQLEDELGVAIVERGQRFRGFTKEGLCVLDYARRIIADFDALKQDVGQLRDGVIGRLRLGAIPSAMPIVSLLLAPFTRKYPGVTVAALARTALEIRRGIEEFELDAGVTYLEEEPLKRVRTTPLYREEYVLLVPETSRLAKRKSVGWAEASDERLCLLMPDMQARRVVDGIFRSIGIEPRPAVETDSVVHLCTHVSAGGGVSIVSRPLVQLIGAPAGTRALPLVDPEVSRTIGLVIADRELPSPLARNIYAVAAALDLEPILSSWRG